MPVISGNANRLRGNFIDSAAPSDGNVLTWDNANSWWEPAAAAAGGGQTLYETIVDASGNGDYTLLSTALAAGKTSIFIRNGTYIETADIDTIANEIIIVGENWYKTIIDFNSNTQLDVSHPNFNISNLTITGGNGNGALRLRGGSVRGRINKCRFHSNSNVDIRVDGIQNIIKDCIFESSSGVSINSRGNVVEGCNFTNGGISLLSSSEDTRVSNCSIRVISISGNRNIVIGNVLGDDDLSKTGVISINGNENIIQGNALVRGGATTDAIIVTGARNSIKGNIIQGDAVDYRDGIVVSTGDNNIIEGNQCIANDQYGINISTSGAVDNIVLGNHLIDNVTAPINDAGLGTTIKNNYPTDIIQDEKRFIQMKNTSGGQLVQGDIVTLKAVAAGNEVTTTAVQGDNLIFGMIDAIIADAATGRVQILGKTTALKVDGTADIAIGDFIGTFTTAKIGMKAAAGDMAFAIALEAYATNDSAGVIDALLISPRKI